jgi:hypothetical protein
MSVPALFILGSWAAFKFVWNITPEIREKMASAKVGLAVGGDDTVISEVTVSTDQEV